MIFVNFKSYQQASGVEALKLVKICELISQRFKVPIIPCVQSLDLPAVADKTKLPVWVQHFDPFSYGQHTGYVIPQLLKIRGASGSLLNHSEHPLNFADLKKAVSLAKAVALKTLILAVDLKTAKTYESLAPDYLGLEEPSLIASGTAMVKSEGLRKMIKQFVYQTHKAIPIIGAGISSAADIKQSLALGVKGVLVASAVVLAENPKSVLAAMARAFS